jgi:hypothetical protein
VFVGGEQVGEVTSACYSPRLKTNIGYAMLPAGLAEPLGQVTEVETPTGHHRGVTVRKPFIDPNNEIPSSDRTYPARRAWPATAGLPAAPFCGVMPLAGIKERGAPCCLQGAGDRDVRTCCRSSCAWRNSCNCGPAKHSPARRESGSGFACTRA